jgi:isopentenyl-diphosphate delta-isomerase
MISKNSMDIKQDARKKDHIDLAVKAQVLRALLDERFIYEPLLSGHPKSENTNPIQFFGKTLKAPLWVSSMTGGTGEARHINQNLARVCREFGLGMGLGSCRILLDENAESKKYFPDFNLRPVLGGELPFFANLGIAQIEQLIEKKETQKIVNLLGALSADGLMIHVNPLQEWFQPEGDRLKCSPLETLTKLCGLVQTQIVVKEVGQGMGPKSLKALLELPIAGIELAGFGGTNFTRIEQVRAQNTNTAFSHVGHTPVQMIQYLNDLGNANSAFKQKQIIISGGIENCLDGFYLRENLTFSSVIGQAKNFLVHAENYDDLKKFTAEEIEGLQIAKAYLSAKPLVSVTRDIL